MRSLLVCALLLLLPCWCLSFTAHALTPSTATLRLLKELDLDPTEPIALVPLTEEEKARTALLEVGNFNETENCQDGMKCPVEGGQCCEESAFCCVYGCRQVNPDGSVLCLKNDLPLSVVAAKNRILEEIKDDEEKENWMNEQAFKRRSVGGEFRQKTRLESKEKDNLKRNEKEQKRHNRVAEEQVKDNQHRLTQARRQREESKKFEEAQKKAQRMLPLQKDMRAYEKGYRSPKYSVLDERFCILSGMVLGKKLNALIASLPPVCRPAERLVFDLHISGAQTSRYDVTPDGNLMWKGGAFRKGGNLGHWLPLDGIAFNVVGTHELRVPLSPPWVDYGHAGYQGARYGFTSDGLCVVSGLIRTVDKKAASMTNPLFVIDPKCRPDARLVFSVNSHDVSFRVDLKPNGEGILVAGTKRRPWLSLSGMIYYKECPNPLELHSNWEPAGDEYRAPCWSKRGTLCILSGMAKVKSAWDATIAKIPSHCAPADRLVFGLNAQDQSQRIDVFPSGLVRWIDGAKGFVSFDGIRYVVP